MNRIIHAVSIRAPRRRVYDALATLQGLAGWWTTTVTGESAVGGTLAFRFAEVFKPDMRVDELVSESLVRWTCVAGEPNWLDNVFSFELGDDGTMTGLMFRQDYARELDERTYGQYNYSWGYYLTSLKSLCETGSGNPFGAPARP
ncbi:MAG TPA: SRPBCC domain-containing protein [Gemmatimonadaceae bacterium]|nr:SRPBCC domain-containing protein [Gemmatimonadaceae bacterium]